MQVLLVVAIFISVLFILALVTKVVNRELQLRKKNRALTEEIHRLRDVLELIARETQLQEEAGYSDVTAFRHVLNATPEAPQL